LRGALDPGIVVQTMAVPASIACDLEFYGKLPRLVPRRNARCALVAKTEPARLTAWQSGTL
jgi:hypothetical protein